MRSIFRFILIIILLFLGILIFVGGGLGKNDNLLQLNNGEPLIFAHRGHPDINVENTVGAINRSKELGFSAIEIDIRRTKDGRIILFHDENCNKLLGIDDNINNLNWIDVKDKYLLRHGKPTTDKVLLFEDYLAQKNDSLIMYLDIKEATMDIADSLISLLNKYDNRDKIVIADDNPFFLCYVRSKTKGVAIALEGFNAGKEWIYYIIPKNFKPDYYASFLDKIDDKHIEFLKEKNLLQNKIVYGVNKKIYQCL